jgi:uncharacterized Zn-finger protein
MISIGLLSPYPPPHVWLEMTVKTLYPLIQMILLRPLQCYIKKKIVENAHGHIFLGYCCNLESITFLYSSHIFCSLSVLALNRSTA